MNTRKLSEQTGKIQGNSDSTPGSPTPEVEEGPYYKPGSPLRTKLYEEGVQGEKLTLTGYVLDADGKPVPHAWLDFWQADGKGEYDNAGYRLRGHQYTDESGRYILETVIPAGYAIRTPHIHAKVRANDESPVITVQLFFPGVDTNREDFLYRDDLLVDMKDTPDGKVATFNFKLKE